LQERAQTLLAFGADTDARNGIFAIAAQGRGERAVTDFTPQVLAGAHRRRAVLQQVGDPLFHLLVQFANRVAFRQQADFPCTLAAKALGGQGIAPRRPFADGLHHERADHGRGQADAHFRQAKLRVIGAEDAQFCLSEVRIGLAPAVISPFVVQAIGERAARRYALTAERFGGQRAREIGLLAESYPAESLDQQVDLWVTNLLQNSPAAMRASKDLLREVGNGALTPALRRYCENAIARIRVSAEGQEGLRAFLQKRAPSWQTQEPRS